ncbi:hypothetical protein LCGC14_1945450, partial [marine sediment metagenome]
IKVMPISHTHKELMKEWSYERNDILGLDPEKITMGSRIKVFWHCTKDKSLVWEARIDSRTRKNRYDGCPYCVGKIVCYHNCLNTKFPEIAKEWHPTLNNILGPEDVTPGMDKEAFWQCQKNKNHVWKTLVSKRVCSGNGCPFCHRKSEAMVNDILLKYLSDWTIIPNKKIWHTYKDYNHKRFCDFWLEKDGVKIMVEYDGQQHFMPVSFGCRDKNKVNDKFKKTQLKDKLDSKFCEENNLNRRHMWEVINNRRKSHKGWTKE